MSVAVLVVTSHGAPSAAVVPVMAALEASGAQVQAIDVGGAGSSGAGVSDRMRRALLGESAERRLRKAVNQHPFDVAIVFDPFAAMAMTVVRDGHAQPIPVIAICAELAPQAAWAQTDVDRLLAVDDDAAYALAAHGVEGDRIVVVGAFGEVAYAQAAQLAQTDVRTRFGLGPRVVVVAVANVDVEAVSQLLMQLSLSGGMENTMLLFDAGADAEVAAVIRRSVPALGLRGKLFGQTADAPFLWRSADLLIAPPTAQMLTRALQLGVPLLALPGGADAARDDQGLGALAARGRAVSAASLLLLASEVESLLTRRRMGAALSDGAAAAAAVVMICGSEKHDVVEERRAAVAAATRERVKQVHAAGAAFVASTAVPTELEDLGGPRRAPVEAPAPDAQEVATLQARMQQRKQQLAQASAAAQRAAAAAEAEASAARGRNDATAAQMAQKNADVERAKMHGLLGEMAALDRELAELAATAEVAATAARASQAAPRGASVPADLDEQLRAMKASAAKVTPGPAPRASHAAAPSGGARDSSRKVEATVDDELAALKRKMQSGGKK